MHSGEIFASLIAVQFAGAAFAYGLVWLVMRQKAGRRMPIPLVWHSCGLAITVMASALFRVIAMASFGGPDAYEPNANTGAAAFYTLFVPAIVAAVYIGLLRRYADGRDAVLPHLGGINGARREKALRWFNSIFNSIKH